MSQLRVGVIGYGYWGPNVVRNLFALDGCEVAAIADGNPAVLQKALRLYPGLRTTTDACEVLTSSDIDAVAIVTPARCRSRMAPRSIEGQAGGG